MAKAPWMQQQAPERFQRKRSEFRDRISSDGSTEFPAEPGRYHLFVQYACPWAHRTLAARALLGLDAVTFDVVSWRMAPDGSWDFEPELDGCTPDSQLGARNLQQIYQAAEPGFEAIGTVPVLWDKEAGTIVNNESREILRMLDTGLAPAAGRRREETLLPPDMEKAVDAMIDANYETVNNGVYKCGFAGTQGAYDDAIAPLFERLDELEAHLEGRAWLLGDETDERRWAQPQGSKGAAGTGSRTATDSDSATDSDPRPGILTEADLCLWTTLLRFDPVYHTHFKCNVKKIAEYPNLWDFTRRFYHLPGIAETVDFDHIRRHYYWSHTRLNPLRIVPRGPDMETLLA